MEHFGFFSTPTSFSISVSTSLSHILTVRNGYWQLLVKQGCSEQLNVQKQQNLAVCEYPKEPYNFHRARFVISSYEVSFKNISEETVTV